MLVENAIKPLIPKPLFLIVLSSYNDTHNTPIPYSLINKRIRDREIDDMHTAIKGAFRNKG